MKRVLVFCARDWLHPRAGPIERYVHEVFSRVAARGHYVAWIAHSWPWRYLPRQAPRVQVEDGIQIVRLGPRILFPFMLKLFLSRLKAKAASVRPFDAVIDCIAGRPLPLADRIDARIIPLVFSLHRSVAAAENPPGPIIAATAQARQQLVDAGAPDRSIVYAPGGESGGSEMTSDLLDSWDRTARVVLSTIENLVGPADAHPGA